MDNLSCELEGSYMGSHTSKKRRLYVIPSVNGRGVSRTTDGEIVGKLPHIVRGRRLSRDFHKPERGLRKTPVIVKGNRWYETAES